MIRATESAKSSLPVSLAWFLILLSQVLTQEIQSGMRLLGARSIKELRPEMLELLDGLVGAQLK